MAIRSLAISPPVQDSAKASFAPRSSMRSWTLDARLALPVAYR
jgi:hypothetical protein